LLLRDTADRPSRRLRARRRQCLLVRSGLLERRCLPGAPRQRSFVAPASLVGKTAPAAPSLAWPGLAAGGPRPRYRCPLSGTSTGPLPAAG